MTATAERPIPAPSEIASLDDLAEALDAATHEARVAWIRSLGGKAIQDLFARAEGRAVAVSDLVDAAGAPVPCEGKNGLAAFNRFAKVFARVDDEVVGYNRTTGLAAFFGGPGHFVAYDATDETDGAPGEVVIDYRRLPARTHPDFPALRSNDRGTARLIYGGMYDLVRRVSRHVFVGDSFRDLPGGAPFIIVRPS